MVRSSDAVNGYWLTLKSFLDLRVSTVVWLPSSLVEREVGSVNNLVVIWCVFRTAHLAFSVCAHFTLDLFVVLRYLVINLFLSAKTRKLLQKQKQISANRLKKLLVKCL
ncbi:unnamed protein product [Colias eurytheme]|nr:unnamed protein product [Colias eurytheme]